MTTLEAEAPPAPRSSLRQVIFASLIGTTIEWYDFFLYGTAAALVFGKLFFPRSDPLVGVMLAFATNALGFAARPIGGLVFGHFGDRIGRKRLLMLSLILMGVSSAAMGLLPTYAQAGLAAPLMLTALRLVQGFAVGGEWGGAVLMAGEFGDARRRGTWAGWPQVGVPVGNLLAAGVLAVMAAAQNEKDFLTWGWRVPFLLSAVLVAIGWWVRSRLSESPVFEAAVARASEALDVAPALQALRHRPRGIAIGAGLRLGENICYYVITTYSIAFLTDQVHVSRALALNAVLAGSLAEALTMPLFSALSDRLGRRPVFAFGAGGMVVWAFAFFALLQTGQVWPVIAAIVVGLVLHGAMYGPQAAFMSELFPTRYRYSGASIAYQVTSIFAGSLAPIIAVELFRRTHSTTPISIYVAGACAVSAIAALIARETKGKSFAEIDAEPGAG
ncbi:MAG: MFS transporter [Caulobacterales bacterium]